MSNKRRKYLNFFPNGLVSDNPIKATLSLGVNNDLFNCPRAEATRDRGRRRPATSYRASQKLLKYKAPDPTKVLVIVLRC